ncbi:hypothetical protein J6590_099398 [Homalodisca vitripennis]|nr:hypothetical protein J6590_099398 [Homalodisca vitripennis]
MVRLSTILKVWLIISMITLSESKVESVPVRPRGRHCRRYQPTIGGITDNVTTLFS